jgi:hypothetical protein
MGRGSAEKLDWEESGWRTSRNDGQGELGLNVYFLGFE